MSVTVHTQAELDKALADKAQDDVGTVRVSPGCVAVRGILDEEPYWLMIPTGDEGPEFDESWEIAWPR